MPAPQRGGSTPRGPSLMIPSDTISSWSSGGAAPARFPNHGEIGTLAPKPSGRLSGATWFGAPADGVLQWGEL